MAGCSMRKERALTVPFHVHPIVGVLQFVRYEAEAKDLLVDYRVGPAGVQRHFRVAGLGRHAIAD